MPYLPRRTQGDLLTIGIRILLVLGAICFLFSEVSAQWQDNGTVLTTDDVVGIGTTSPGAGVRLDIVGGDLRVVNQALQFSSLLDFTKIYRDGAADGMVFWTGDTAVGARMFIGDVGNIGIGTTSPSERLHVIGRAQFDNSGGSFVLQPSNTGTQIGVVTGEPLHLYNGENRLSVLNNGNVGIGTTSPVAKLHVAGDAVIDGNIAAKYQDVAEWVSAPFSIEAGTVVVLNTEQTNQVIPSSNPYDIRVAGVISEMPGILLGEAGRGKVKVATTGRVKVKVDASQGPINVGDLLVTSDQKGVAMRSEPITIQGRQIHSPGTILGKALEPLKEGEGEILVLLSLQ